MATWGESRPKSYVCYLCGQQFGSARWVLNAQHFIFVHVNFGIAEFMWFLVRSHACVQVHVCRCMCADACVHACVNTTASWLPQTT